MRRRRVGLLGGTFDPVHMGHLEAAAAARRSLQLDPMLLLPARTPPHRHASPQVSAFHRFAMVALAVAENAGLVASDADLLADEPSYTSNTLARMHARGYSPAELFFVLGTDAFSDIAAWHRYPTVLEAANFVIVARPGTTLADIRAQLPDLRPRMIDAVAFADVTDERPRILLLPARTPDVSSTEIRRRLAAGQTVAGLTPPSVINHIERHGLYRVNS